MRSIKLTNSIQSSLLYSQIRLIQGSSHQWFQLILQPHQSQIRRTLLEAKEDKTSIFMTILIWVRHKPLILKSSTIYQKNGWVIKSVMTIKMTIGLLSPHPDRILTQRITQHLRICVSWTPFSCTRASKRTSKNMPTNDRKRQRSRSRLASFVKPAYGSTGCASRGPAFARRRSWNVSGGHRRWKTPDR